MDICHFLQVPVGRETLGRIINVIGEPVDERGPVSEWHGWVWDMSWGFGVLPTGVFNRNPCTIA